MTDTPTLAEPHRTPEIDEVFRRIGRNLLLFQHIEHLLKQLMASARLEGTVKSMQANFEERQAKIHKQTLGQLAGQFVDDVLADAGERDAPENVDEAWFSFGFTIQTDSAFVEQHTAEMKAVVDARNDLIHHFLPRWSPASEDSSRACAAPPEHAAGGRWRTPVREGVAGRADRASSPGSTREAPLGAWPAGPASCGAWHVARRSDRRSKVRRSLRSSGRTTGTEPVRSAVRRGAA